MKITRIAFITIFSCISFLNVNAQTRELPINPENNRIRFQEVVQESGTKDELFNRSINWLNNYYRDPVRITSVRDQATGKIIGRHTIKLNVTGDDGIRRDGPMVFYEFTLEMRDDRYRYIITDLLLRTASRFEIERWLNTDDPSYDPRWADYLDQIAEYVAAWAENLKEMMKPEPVFVEEEW
jgi:hypothetical protein